MSYVPTEAEVARCDQLIARLTPSPDGYRAYRTLARLCKWAHEQQPLTISYRDRVVELSTLTLRKSALFGSRYLVAYVDPEWLRQIAPNCDAIAAKCHVGEDGVQPPPMVLVPASKLRARGTFDRSVIEHEFVHINQMLLGRFPEPLSEATAQGLFRSFTQELHAGKRTCCN